MPIGGGNTVSGKAPTNPPQGSAAQVGAQSGQARDLAESQQSTINDLRQALAVGDITQEQYNDAVGQLFDARLAQLQGDLQEQGRPQAAAAVPVGIGTSSAPAPAPGPTPFGPPPQGVALEGQNQGVPLAPLTEDESLLAGPTARPGESVTGPSIRGRVPPEVLAAIPALLEAAKDPDAPPAVRALLQLLDQMVNG